MNRKRPILSQMQSLYLRTDAHQCCHNGVNISPLTAILSLSRRTMPLRKALSS